jgi:hypothetical protein
MVYAATSDTSNVVLMYRETPQMEELNRGPVLQHRVWGAQNPGGCDGAGQGHGGSKKVTISNRC